MTYDLCPSPARPSPVSYACQAPREPHQQHHRILPLPLVPSACCASAVLPWHSPHRLPPPASRQLLLPCCGSRPPTDTETVKRAKEADSMPMIEVRIIHPASAHA
ncbi:hypothetical protein BKA80DRAFT_47189 [Phyllosticta citrichinensis]